MWGKSVQVTRIFTCFVIPNSNTFLCPYSHSRRNLWADWGEDKGNRKYRIQGRGFRIYEIQSGGRIRFEFPPSLWIASAKYLPVFGISTSNLFLIPIFLSPKELSMELRAEKGKRRYCAEGWNFRGHTQFRVLGEFALNLRYRSECRPQKLRF